MRRISVLILWSLFLALPTQAASIYRWVDAEGKVHYGDKPPASKPPGAASRLKRIERYSERYTIQTALDGDTLMLTNGTRVRLIGVNAPEIAHNNTPNQPGGQEAMEFLYKLAKDKKVRLESEVQRFDRYHRRLAHPILPDGRSITSLLLRSGMVHVSLVPPNIARAEQLFKDEAYARRRKVGLWALPEYQVLPARNAAAYRNTWRRLRGKVVSVQPKLKYTYLHFESGLVVYFDNENLQRFIDAGRDPLQLEGRSVVVRGWVRQQSGQPVIRLSHPLEIESVR